jgi:hypothetical protein
MVKYTRLNEGMNMGDKPDGGANGMEDCAVGRGRTDGGVRAQCRSGATICLHPDPSTILTCPSDLSLGEVIHFPA